MTWGSRTLEYYSSACQHSTGWCHDVKWLVRMVDKRWGLAKNTSTVTQHLIRSCLDQTEQHCSAFIEGAREPSGEPPLHPAVEFLHSESASEGIGGDDITRSSQAPVTLPRNGGKHQTMWIILKVVILRSVFFPWVSWGNKGWVDIGFGWLQKAISFSQAMWLECPEEEMLLEGRKSSCVQMCRDSQICFFTSESIKTDRKKCEKSHHAWPGCSHSAERPRMLEKGSPARQRSSKVT